MRANLMAILILACIAAGCTSPNTGGRNPGRDNAVSLDPSRSKSCYSRPVYVPC